jgi:heme-degrading monooxygenase HmoA
MSAAGFAALPDPPYWAVIFSSRRRGGAEPADDPGYAAAAQRMVELAADQPGFLGIESSRDGSGFGITVSYWQSPEALLAWRRQVEHAAIREQGRERWYEHYELRVAAVERAYGWDLP